METRQPINKVKLSDLPLLDELDEFEIFFHGTSHKSAKAIIDCIDLKEGGPRMEFSHGDGFYVFNDFFAARYWAASTFSDHHSAVLVFRVTKMELRGDNNNNGLDLTGMEQKKEWQELVNTFRSAKPSKINETKKNEKNMTLLKSLWQLMEDKVMKNSHLQKVTHISSVFGAKDVLKCSTEAFVPWFISTLLVDFFINCKNAFLHPNKTKNILVLASAAFSANFI